MKKAIIFILGFILSCHLFAVEPKVVFNLLDEAWGFPTSEYVKDSVAYFNNEDTIILTQSNSGHKLRATSQTDPTPVSLIFGKKNARMILPKVSFATDSIIIRGHEGASGAVEFNIYVGEYALLAENLVGAKEAHTVNIPDAYKAAGTKYTIKINSAHNTQVSSVEFYGTDVPASISNPQVNTSNKVLKGNQIVIVRDNKTYNIFGQNL